MLTKLKTTKGGRMLTHAVLAFAGVLVPALVFTSTATLEASALAAIPAALAAAFAATATS